MNKILIIEDDNILSKAINTVLTKEGYETLIGIDGEDALLKVKEFKPDLILLDLILPKKSGEEVLVEIMKNAETKNIPVLVVTVKSEDESVARCIDLGARGYFIKAHYTLDEITNKIKQTLSEIGE